VRKRYRFRLQAVLDLRMEELNRTQQRVATEELKRVQILQRIQEADHLISQAFEEQKTALNATGPDFNSIQQFSYYLTRLKQTRFQEQTSLQNHERTLTVVREELKQAMIRKKALETLKENGMREHRQAVEKAEEENLAEIALMRRRFAPTH
jgi:flagellar export protein FliJ